jgi:hypothetical protein
MGAPLARENDKRVCSGDVISTVWSTAFNLIASMFAKEVGKTYTELFPFYVMPFGGPETFKSVKETAIAGRLCQEAAICAALHSAIADWSISHNTEQSVDISKAFDMKLLVLEAEMLLQCVPKVWLRE